MGVHAGHFPFTNRLPSRYLEIAIHKELSAGRGGPRGGVLADFRKGLEGCDLTDTARKLWPTTQKWFASRGMELDKQPVEIACFAHAMNGGFRVDEDGETSVKGLFAVGETAGGSHGADRLGGGMLAACQVFGKRAGRAATDWAKRENRGHARRDDLGGMTAKAKRFAPGSGSGTYSPAEIKREIQELSFRHLLLIRTGEGLLAFQRELDNVLEKLNRDCRIETSRETMQAIEVENLIQTGKIMAGAALARRETRGSHVREDFPETSPMAEWAIIRQGQSGEPSITFVPVSGA
jgi:fumarate reductase (CoM/CoB) subunit A